MKIGPYCIDSLLGDIQDVNWEEPLRFLQDPCITADDKRKKFVSMIAAKNLQFFIFVMIIEHNQNPSLLTCLFEFGGSSFLVRQFDWINDEGDTRLDSKDSNQEEIGFGNTLLHFACMTDVPINLLNEMIDKGGKDLVMAINCRKETALHLACRNNSSIEVINKIIEVGGKELLLKENYQGENTLYYACYYSSIIDIQVVKRLVDLGGKELIMNVEPNHHFSTLSLLYFRRCNAPHTELIQEFINVGGEDILTLQDIEGRHALKYWIQRHRDFPWTENKKAAIRLMVAESIKLDIWSEFTIGGLICCNTPCVRNCCCMVQQERCMIWEKVVPFLEDLLRSLKQPILHAAILNRAPQIFFDQISEDHFDWSLNIRDSTGQLPIEIAMQEKLGWYEGMKQIVEKTAINEEQSVISIAAQYGVGWVNGIQEIIVQGGDSNLIQYKDGSTGLYPFMLAATGNDCDLDAIFNLLHPDLLMQLL